MLTKLDGTAKGGIVIAVQRELGIPVKLVGLGEGVNDLVAFYPDALRRRTPRDWIERNRSGELAGCAAAASR